MIPVLSQHRQRRRTVAGGGFDPSDLAGLSRRFESDQGAYNDAAGTTPSGNNDSAERWSDLSGAGGHLLATGNSWWKPTYKTGQLNGLPIIDFDQLYHKMTMSSPPTGFSEQTVVTAIRFGQFSSSGSILGTGASSNDWNTTTNFIWFASGGTVQCYMNSSNMLSASSVSTGVWYILTLIMRSGNAVLRRNGAQVASGTYTPGTLSPSIARINHREATGGSDADLNKYAALLWYTDGLSDAEAAQVEDYVNDKYAIY